MWCLVFYAFACARLLLNPQALEFLVHCATTTTTVSNNNNDDNTVPSNSSSSSSEEFEQVFTNFCQWLGDRNVEDIVVTVPTTVSSSLEIEKQDRTATRKKERSSNNTNGIITTTALGTTKKWKKAPIW